MSLRATIRPECPEDMEVIARVTERAFRLHPQSSHTEQLIIQALRRAGALSVSLVAEVNGQVVGHIAFSPVHIEDGSQHWFGLGPVAVVPELQSQGIGQALVNAGLAALRARGAQGCVVLGEPEFYGRFGFRSRTECKLEGVPEEYFQSLAFGSQAATGKVIYHEAFRFQG